MSADDPKTSASSEPAGRGWAAPARWLERVDRWLAAHRLGTGLWVVAVAALLRWLYLRQVQGTLGFGQGLVDALDYQRMARGILEGTWPGEAVFFVDPLYAYLLAGLESLGVGASGVIVLQLAGGSLAVGLLYLAAASFLRPSQALFAGLLAATYGVFFFFEALLLKTSSAVLVLALLCYTALRARRTGPSAPLASFLVGALLGMGVLLRGNLLALAPIFLLWLAWPRREDEPRRRGGAPLAVGLYVLGLALAIAPATAHNLAAGDRVVDHKRDRYEWSVEIALADAEVVLVLGEQFGDAGRVLNVLVNQDGGCVVPDEVVGKRVGVGQKRGERYEAPSKASSITFCFISHDRPNTSYKSPVLTYLRRIPLRSPRMSTRMTS